MAGLLTSALYTIHAEKMLFSIAAKVAMGVNQEVAVSTMVQQGWVVLPCIIAHGVDMTRVWCFQLSLQVLVLSAFAQQTQNQTQLLGGSLFSFHKVVV